MPPAKTIIVDELKLLAAILDHSKAAIAQFKDEAKQLEREWEDERSAYWKWTECCDLRYAAETVKKYGLLYDLPLFAGRDLTASERIRHQQAIRRMEERGWVERTGKRIKVTKAGKQALEAKPIETQ